MGWFSKKITITGTDAQEAHALMHEFGIEHHAFHDFNGLGLTEVGGMIVERGSSEVTIPLHGKAARNPQGVVNVLRERNSNWKISI